MKTVSSAPRTKFFQRWSYVLIYNITYFYFFITYRRIFLQVNDFAVGKYEGVLVGLKRIKKDDIQLTREHRKEILLVGTHCLSLQA